MSASSSWRSFSRPRNAATNLLETLANRLRARLDGVKRTLGLVVFLALLVVCRSARGEQVLVLVPHLSVPGLEGLRQLQAHSLMLFGAACLLLEMGQPRLDLVKQQRDSGEVVARRPQAPPAHPASTGNDGHRRPLRSDRGAHQGADSGPCQQRPGQGSHSCSDPGCRMKSSRTSRRRTRL